jgi:RecA-family ATPase
MNRLKAIIRETSCSVLFLHHLTKQGASRGSSAIRAAVDFMISVSKSGDYITLSTKDATKGKTRDTAPIEFQAQVNFNPAEYCMKHVEGAAAVNRLDEDQRLILTYLLRCDNQSKKDIEKGTQLKNARYPLEALERKSYVKKQDGYGGSRCKAYYSIVPEAREPAQAAVNPRADVFSGI